MLPEWGVGAGLSKEYMRCSANLVVSESNRLGVRMLKKENGWKKRGIGCGWDVWSHKMEISLKRTSKI